jgi:ornithine cyclodeaminase
MTHLLSRHHAIKAEVMTEGSVHAELGEAVAGKKPGRTRDGEITLFDAAGTGLQDAAAAIAVFRRAVEERAATTFYFSGGNAR